MSVFKTAKKLNEPQSLEVKRLSPNGEIKITVDQLTKEQRPGYLAVEINNYQLEESSIQFFGVKEEGEDISGEGVSASRVDNNNGKLIAYFDMSKLVSKDQFTSQTVEGVIMVDSGEIGRQSILTQPAIYLG
ncbi:hypothetical protein JCM16358_16320 [Halanaerocella petrolearia]